MILLSFALLVIDLVTKYLTTTFIDYGQTVDFIPYVLSLTYVKNDGAAWSLFAGSRWYFVAITVVILAVITGYIIKKKPQSKLARLSFALIFAGALGNLVERILYGFVTDMIQTEFMTFPVFNFADCCVVVGTGLLCLYILKEG